MSDNSKNNDCYEMLKNLHNFAKNSYKYGYLYWPQRDYSCVGLSFDGPSKRIINQGAALNLDKETEELVVQNFERLALETKNFCTENPEHKINGWKKRLGIN